MSSSSSSTSISYDPLDPSKYLSRDYWEWRFQNEVHNEWCRGYSEFREFVVKKISRTDRILIVGCGNSNLGEDLIKDGYLSVTSMDFSVSVLENMRSRYQNQQNPTNIVDDDNQSAGGGRLVLSEWICCDMMKMPFRNNSFDVVIEKSTLDVLFTDCVLEITKEAKRRMQVVMREVSRVLTDSGKFLSISYYVPMERLSHFTCFKQIDYIPFCKSDNTYMYYLYVAQHECNKYNNLQSKDYQFINQNQQNNVQNNNPNSSIIVNLEIQQSAQAILKINNKHNNRLFQRALSQVLNGQFRSNNIIQQQVNNNKQIDISQQQSNKIQRNFNIYNNTRVENGYRKTQNYNNGQKYNTEKQILKNQNSFQQIGNMNGKYWQKQKFSRDGSLHENQNNNSDNNSYQDQYLQNGYNQQNKQGWNYEKDGFQNWKNYKQKKLQKTWKKEVVVSIHRC